MIKKISVLLLLLTSVIFSQPHYWRLSFSETVFPPGGNLFPSNFSDPLEARIGTQFYLDDKTLELNIGASKDVFQHIYNYRNSIATGVEFFSWTLLNRESNFRFPVIAVDYLFGGYFVFYHRGRNLDWVNRLRISHISAHLVDGSFDKKENRWSQDRLPFTYSREFIQWTSLFIHNSLKLYFNATYLFHSIPEWRNNTSTGIGAEVIAISFPEIHTKIFSGFDLKFQKILSNKFEANSNFSVGFILGNEYLTHFRIAYQFYNGYHFHGEFFDKKIKQSFINLSLVI